MFRNLIFIFAAVIMIVSFSLPVSVLAQQNNMRDLAKQDAINDANQHFSSVSWCLAGVGCSILGPAYALVSEPDVPNPNKLIGKSPIYVGIYTLTYKRHAKRKRLRNAAAGCGINAGISLIFMRIYADDIAETCLIWSLGPLAPHNH